MVWESSPYLTTANVALMLVQGLLPIASLYILKLLVDEVTQSVTLGSSEASFSNLGVLVAFFGGISLLKTLFSNLSRLVTKSQGEAVKDYMYGLLHQKSIEADLAYYENSQYYDTLHRAQSEVSHRPISILKAILGLGRDFVALVGIAGLLWWFHWMVLPLLILAAIPDIYVNFRYASKLYRWERRRTPENRRVWYLNWMLTKDAHAKEIRLFSLGNLFRNWYAQLRRTLRHEYLTLQTHQTMANFLAETFSVLVSIGLYMFVGYRTVQGLFTVGDLVMFYQAVQRGLDILRILGDNIANLYSSHLFLSNIFEFFDLESQLKDLPSPRHRPTPIKKGLVFDQVSFHYPDQKGPAINTLSLTIQPGEHIALVGENGSGKTTMVKLLARLYDPTAGQILLDGTNIKDYALSQWRQEISILFQDFTRYHMTAKDNIALGNVNADIDLEKVIEASEKAGATSCIERLPLGYDNMLGKWFEGGQELSLGEWQKIALARALIRDAQIVVFDEPTSALDPRAEYELYQRFHQIAQGRIALLISHRLSSVKMADRILLLERGTIIEMGTHDELIKQNGRYANLFTLQAHYYQ